MYLVDYNEITVGGTGLNTASLISETNQLRYFIEDVASLKLERKARSANIQNVINNSDNKQVIAIIGYDDLNCTGTPVGVTLPCPPYCNHEGVDTPPGLKMGYAAALYYLNS